MSFCPRSLIFALCLVVAGTGAARAQSPDGSADARLARGQKLFAAGQYAAAAEELRAGYALSPQPRFQYALGQALRLNHQCKEAVIAYRSFLRSDPTRAQVAAAEENIRRCGDEDPGSLVEPAAPAPKPAVAPVAPAPEPLVATAAPEKAKRPLYKRWWLWTTVGVLAAGAGVGLGVGLTIGLRRTNPSFDSTLGDIGPGASAR